MIDTKSGAIEKQAIDLFFYQSFDWAELAEFWALIRGQGQPLSALPITGYINLNIHGDKYIL